MLVRESVYIEVLIQESVDIQNKKQIQQEMNHFTIL